MTTAGERPDLPERDPLADLVSRSVGARVDTVAVEELGGDGGIERKRLRYETAAGRHAAIFERRAKGRTLEAQLLPFLARKTDRVPRVFARGLPPPHASLGPWVLSEDVLAAPPACDGDAVDVLRAKLAIERAVMRDVPALRALGVPERRIDVDLASAQIGLVHGALVCANAHRSERGVVIVDWSHAFLGPTVFDAASLIADLRRRGDTEGAARIREEFIQDAGGPNAEADLVIAEKKLA